MPTLTILVYQSRPRVWRCRHQAAVTAQSCHELVDALNHHRTPRLLTKPTTLHSPPPLIAFIFHRRGNLAQSAPELVISVWWVVWFSGYRVGGCGSL